MTERTYLISGASKGIGLALARRLQLQGHAVVGLARGAGASFPGRLVSVDLGDADATARVLEQLTGDYRFDGLINNVGLVKPQRLGAITLRDLDEVMRLNLPAEVAGV